MDAWQGELLGYLQLYGLEALGLILFLESVGAPLPGESLLIAAGALAGDGTFNPWVVGAVAVRSVPVSLPGSRYQSRPPRASSGSTQ